jgi:hypothetical protein
MDDLAWAVVRGSHDQSEQTLANLRTELVTRDKELADCIAALRAAGDEGHEVEEFIQVLLAGHRSTLMLVANRLDQFVRLADSCDPLVRPGSEAAVVSAWLENTQLLDLARFIAGGSLPPGSA